MIISRKAAKAPRFFEPPSRQDAKVFGTAKPPSRQDFWNRQAAKAPRKIMEKMFSPFHLALLAPWRLGGSKRFCLAHLASWRFQTVFLGSLGALAVQYFERAESCA